MSKAKPSMRAPAGMLGFRYAASQPTVIAELLGPDRVVPVVIFLRAGQAPRRLELAGERNSYLTFTYLACALAEEPAARHADSTNLVARVNLPNMAHPREVRVAVYREAVRGLLTLEGDGRGCRLG